MKTIFRSLGGAGTLLNGTVILGMGLLLHAKSIENRAAREITENIAIALQASIDADAELKAEIDTDPSALRIDVLRETVLFNDRAIFRIDTNQWTVERIVSESSEVRGSTADGVTGVLSGK